MEQVVVAQEQLVLDFDFLKEEFDKDGFLKFNPEYHENTGSHYDEEELEYLCKYVEVDGIKKMSMALGRTPHSVKQKVHDLRKIGEFEYYRTLNKHW